MRDRVLVWGLSNNRAGTEAVIYNYSKACKNVKFDYLCYEEPSNYKDLFEESENRYFVIPVKIKHPLEYKKALKRFVKNHFNEYKTLWFNINDVSNIDLLIAAKKAGVPRRITHMHNASMPDMFVTQLFSKLNWKKCLSYTTDRWACSKSAGVFLYGEKSFRVIPNMVDAKACAFSAAARESIRKHYKVEDSFVIGAIGRFAAQKNYPYLISVFSEVLKRKANSVLFFVGDGQELEKCVQLTKRLGIEDRVIFAGVKENAKEYLSAFDVFVMPSIYEGLSLAILEAQFNGLPCVISDGVGEESVISLNTTVLPLNDNKLWIESVLGAKRKKERCLSKKADSYDLCGIETKCAGMF